MLRKSRGPNANVPLSEIFCLFIWGPIYLEYTIAIEMHLKLQETYVYKQDF